MAADDPHALTANERLLRRFHSARPRVTSQALARGDSYDRLAAAVPPSARRVLDLGCADAHLLDRLPPGSLGLDLAPVADPRIIRGTARALPFAAGAFDAAVSHLAFMLFDRLDEVVAELRRVVAPGGTFAAVLGGGPTATGDDAFHRLLAVAALAPWQLGDPRAATPRGWRALFGREPARFDRLEVDLTGPFDDVWAFLGASYQLADPAGARAALRAAFPHDPVPCRAVLWLAAIAL